MARVAFFVAGLSIAVALAWAGGLVWFARAMPTAVAEPERRTDAIVVLTGGAERISTGLALLAEGRADRLFISGVGANVRMADLIGAARAADAALVERIAIGTAAADTPGNALETAAWAAGAQIGSIRLVTAAYHMRRSLRELHAVMPGVAIVPHPVFPANVRADWWRAPGTASLIAREYTKYLLTELRLALIPVRLESPP
ncbi:MAG: YdcF family protein [Rhodospirillaceae bacterium]|nr:YdcF family protein [Rhodospirillaceae bacterium]